MAQKVHSWVYILKEKPKNPTNLKRYMHPNAHSSIIYNCQDMEATWPPHAKSWVIGKDPDAGRDWRQEEKGMTEHEMAGWHHRLDGHEFEWTPGDCDGQGGLACWDSWGRKKSDMTEQLNWTELNSTFHLLVQTLVTFLLCVWQWTKKGKVEKRGKCYKWEVRESFRDKGWKVVKKGCIKAEKRE